MNLIEHGAHEASDWLLGVICRNAPRAVELHVLPEGLLCTRPHGGKRRLYGAHIGTFQKGITRRELREELQWVRSKMVNGERW